MLYPRSTESMADNARSFVLPFAISAICIFFLNKLTNFRKFYVSGVQCSTMCVFIFSVWTVCIYRSRLNLHANKGINMHSIEFYKPAINNSFVSGFWSKLCHNRCLLWVEYDIGRSSSITHPRFHNCNSIMSMNPTWDRLQGFFQEDLFGGG